MVWNAKIPSSVGRQTNAASVWEKLLYFIQMCSSVDFLNLLHLL